MDGTKDLPTAMKCVALALSDPLRLRTLVRARVPAVVAAAAADFLPAGLDFARSQPAAAAGGGGARGARAGGGGMSSANASATLQPSLAAAAPLGGG